MSKIYQQVTTLGTIPDDMEARPDLIQLVPGIYGNDSVKFQTDRYSFEWIPQGNGQSVMEIHQEGCISSYQLFGDTPYAIRTGRGLIELGSREKARAKINICFIARAIDQVINKPAL